MCFFLDVVDVDDKTAKKYQEIFWADLKDYQCEEEIFAERAANRACATFAVIKDGKWYERGDMGWWGIVSNEKDENEWYTQIAKLLDEVPDDTLLTIVDCHI